MKVSIASALTLATSRTVSTRLTAGLLTVATLTAGCLTDGDEPPQEPALSEPSVGKDAETGVLKVRFQYSPRTSVYAEGARHYLQISATDGAVVVRRDEGTEQGPGAGYTDSVRLAAGDYTLQTFQRGCDYTDTEGGDYCEQTLGRAEGWCSTPVSIEPGMDANVIISVRLPEKCEVEVS